MEPKGGRYRTLALLENEKEPTPCPRHVYHAFEYAPDLKAVLAAVVPVPPDLQMV
jgi:hypothetical protein